jgi:hypothetical protein
LNPSDNVDAGRAVLIMCVLRGHQADFDSWNVPGWRFEDILPFFIKAESQHRQDLAQAGDIHGSSGDIHGSSGPLPVSDHVHVHELTQAWVKSLGSDGFRTDVDYNAPQQGGNRTASASQVTRLFIHAASIRSHPASTGHSAQRRAHLHSPRLHPPARAPQKFARHDLEPSGARDLRRRQRCLTSLAVCGPRVMPNCSCGWSRVQSSRWQARFSSRPC